MRLPKEVKTNLYRALAQLNAAFPAGDYHLKQDQNIALNAMLDAIFRIRQIDPVFKKLCKDETDRHHLYVISKLRSLNKITEEEFDDELERLQKE